MDNSVSNLSNFIKGSNFYKYLPPNIPVITPCTINISDSDAAVDLGDLDGKNAASDLNTPILEVTGAGAIEFLAFWSNTGTNSLTIRLIIDGVTWYNDYLIGSISSNEMNVIIGSFITDGSRIITIPRPIEFSESFYFSAFNTNAFGDDNIKIRANYRLHSDATIT